MMLDISKNKIEKSFADGKILQSVGDGIGIIRQVSELRRAFGGDPQAARPRDALLAGERCQPF